ncbi:four-carbon acid sugar kinase family protein [Candidatus Enterococcus murrayae]|uniref:Four-carbon acid sugar kinase family protein n=1 Tax=Candidatus Enterococcus murrayae TaxID=2815321 RepID=A0ABS3HHS6_9ENTE|nr:four-carbon acid sugar kinase family protein [Enterococcus sp. MJM16]MBO0453010.1 four-carbon acid sugar kinase family protein [Enterococcus sp. MJM16]
MIKLLVIADDFTGALDTGVQFSKQGISTLVSTDTKIRFSDVDEEVDVLVIDTESRYLAFEEAYKLIHAIIVSAKKAGIPFIYKKVDSALRGNISAEIKAVLDASQEAAIPFLPAYPEMNRVLINGDLYIDRIPVSQSVFAEDPYEPVIESNVLRRLKAEADIDGYLIEENLPEPLNGVLVFDAETNEDLEKQADILEQAELLSISIGCAGFAKVLAEKLFPRTEPKTFSLKGPLVVICGSVNPITRKQVDYVEHRNYPRISLKPHQLLRPDYWNGSEGKKEVAHYLSLMADQALIIFETLSQETSQGIEQHSQELGLAISDFRFKIGRSLGELTQAIWSEKSENTFLFTGGDTLFQSMSVLGINQIKPLAEISAGVVLSAIKWKEQEIQVITKSGGFGNEELFEEISQLTE